MTFGSNLTQSISIEPRLQPCRINLNSSGSVISDGCNDGALTGTIQDFDYAYGNWGSTNSGNVTIMSANGAQNFNRSFTYDSLNRLATLADSNTSQQCRGLSWTYDAWGNRTDQTVTGGTCNTFHQTANTQNRLVGPPYQYDAAGNMTNDGSHTYFYDAENRLTKVDGGSTATYNYDAEGRRVEKATGSTYHDYLYDLTGNVVTEWCTNCAGFTGWSTGYVYFNGQFAAQYSNATTYFAHKDHLGSTRLLTGLNQAVVQNLDYLPFGELNSTDSGTTSHKFTGYERDSETSLDHTQFRQYASSLARWTSPDPAGLAAVDPAFPQSWNRYSYVLNDPLNLVDPRFRRLR